MTKNSIKNIVDADLCTGCTSCVSICPQKAITIIENGNGFLSPKIDLSKCTNCGLCKKICPVCSNIPPSKIEKCFSAWSNDSGNVKNSSSGGLFYEIAKNILEKKGYVAGVILKENRAIHILSKNLRDTQKMRGSKYIQSNSTKTINKILQLSDKDQILFVGTPCQIVGLKNLLSQKKKNLEKFLFVDLICHGIPSFFIFDKYLDCLGISKKTTINFREKSLGWENYSLLLKSKNKEIKILNKKNLFMKTFISDLGLRNSCYNCKFSCNSQADITLGDFWGVPKELKNEKGTSAVIVHTKKGDDLIKDLISRKNIIAKETTFQQIAKGNPKLISGITVKPKKREKFLDSIKKYGFKFVYDKIVVRYLIKKRIKGFIHGILRRLNFPPKNSQNTIT